MVLVLKRPVWIRRSNCALGDAQVDGCFLTQAAIRGGSDFAAKDAERWEVLLEKACGASPGAVQASRDTLVYIDGGWQRKEVTTSD